MTHESTCPVTGTDNGDGASRGLSRREFGKVAVAIGGPAALAACVDRGGDPDVPEGGDPSDLPERQHAWNAFLDRDEHGNVTAPRHHVVLLLEYARDGRATDEDRETVERAFRGIERAYEWSNDGLLFTVGYSPAYFGRFDEDLPASVDLPEPRALAPFEAPELDRPDAVVHLASDHPEVVLEAEEALFGAVGAANGVTLDGTLDGVFERPPVEDTTVRRTGFVGAGLPKGNREVTGIPDDASVDEDAPMYMNFKSDFERSQASEDRVTIERGPFADGTTQQLSKLRLHLDQWYEQDSRYQRVGKMFCPFHAEEGLVEGPGDNLGADSRLDGECIDDIEEQAGEFGMVGHGQKLAAGARRDGQPLLLRRDFDSTDDGFAGLHFLALQARISDFVDTREAMNGEEVADRSGVGQQLNNGILQYLTVQRRGNYLLPPRAHRALPAPDPQ